MLNSHTDQFLANVEYSNDGMLFVVVFVTLLLSNWTRGLTREIQIRVPDCSIDEVAGFDVKLGDEENMVVDSSMEI